jgi:hypothetical protein
MGVVINTGEVKLDYSAGIVRGLAYLPLVT